MVLKITINKRVHNLHTKTFADVIRRECTVLLWIVDGKKLGEIYMKQTTETNEIISPGSSVPLRHNAQKGTGETREFGQGTQIGMPSTKVTHDSRACGKFLS